MDDQDLPAIRKALLGIQSLLSALCAVAIWAIIDAPAIVKLIGVGAFFVLATIIYRANRR